MKAPVLGGGRDGAPPPPPSAEAPAVGIGRGGGGGEGCVCAGLIPISPPTHLWGVQSPICGAGGQLGGLTWKRRMSRGFPAFSKQFWLHLRKNLRKNLGGGNG